MSTPSEPAIVVHEAVVARGRSPVLRVDHLEFGPGYHAVVGPNGSGKSTLLHAVAGLLHASGRIEVFGDSPRRSRRRVAYVMQSQHASEHLLVTARDVVSLGRAARRGPVGRLDRDDRRAVDAAMERLDVTNLARRHLAEMSGGQRQRIFVAQGLAQDADVLLLDEPVAGLDLTSIELIRAAVEAECRAGRTVLVATHDLAEAATADQVVLLDGRVVSSGPPDVALAPSALREAYGGRVLDLGGGMVAIDDGVHHDDHEHHHHDHHHHDHHQHDHHDDPT